MPAFLNWLLRLLPTNPICMRLVQGGSRQLKHLYIRSGYLAVMILVLLFALIGSTGTLSLRDLAGAGANMFQNVSYLQVALICILTPIFMAGAIAQEANPRTWEILLTTPLNNIQVVLGNLFGRLFFVIALLASSLPLFVMTQYFGGVPGESIFASYAIAGTSALVVAAIAVTLSVTRTAGRRAVLIFYASVIMYLFLTYGADLISQTPVAGAVRARHTSWFTAINPFLALKVLLDSNSYVPWDFTGENVSWIRQWLLSRPIHAYCWICVILSVGLMLFSTIRVRTIGARTGSVPWYRKALGLGGKDAAERRARTVGKNPISWRESVARGKTLGGILGRWGFLATGVLTAIILLTLFHTGEITRSTMQYALATVLAAEVVIITLAALNMSATAVSREREDGSLDIILTTPIQPGPYLRGKHQGLLQYLIPMLLAPCLTCVIVGGYCLLDGFGNDAVMENVQTRAGTTVALPVLLPESIVTVPLMLVPFTAFVVMVGLHWSIRSKGTISSVIAAVAVIGVIAGVLTLCGSVSGQNMNVIGGVMAGASPITTIVTVIFPQQSIPDAIGSGLAAARTSIVVGAVIWAALYIGISYALHTNMTRSFMMTVRRLAGTS